ncbi:MAG: GEVED domain-containing protein [Flavobacteriales bacterium]
MIVLKRFLFLPLISVFIFLFNIENTFAQYCTSFSTNASFASTSLVSIGTLNNNTSGCANYSDYTGIYSELVLNTTYSLTIGLENCSGFNAPKISSVYIDWNGNSFFEPGEEVFHINATSTLLAAQTNFNTNITVPPTASQDTILMRVVTQWSLVDNTNDFSCGTYAFGETEDYSLVIKGLIDNVTTTQNLCFGDSLGVIEIDADDTAPLAYSIDGGLNYFSSSTFNNLPNGIYNICVFDSSINLSQCYNNNPVVINSPDSLFALTSIQNISCYNGNDGLLSTQAFNGQAPYSYEWSDGVSMYFGNQINNLQNGNYSLSVIDNNGCIFNLDNIILSMPDELVIDSLNLSSYSTFNLSCFDANDGFVDIYASGGTGALSYNFNSSVSNLSFQNNLSAGLQTLVVFDNNFCETDTNFFLTAPPAITVDNTVIHVGCENENDGSFTTNISGGVAPYDLEITNFSEIFSINNSAGNSIFDNLTVDNYDLIITDLNGCVYIDSFKVENPQLSLSTENVRCYTGSNGQINYSINFSTDVFNLISPPSITDLTAGDYSFLVENDQGCFFDTIVTITEPTNFESSENVPIICNEADLADISIVFSGGVEPYSLIWSTGDTVFNTSYGVGSYTYQCVDYNGCVVDGTIDVLPPNIPELSYSLISPSCDENFDGSVEVFVDKGYPPFDYMWQDGRNESLIDSLPPNIYRLTVVDSADCSSDLLEVKVPYVYNDCFYFPDAFTPNGDGINDVYEVSSIFSRNPVELSIYNRLGALLYRSDVLRWNGEFNGVKCQVGTYNYILRYANQYKAGEILLLE